MVYALQNALEQVEAHAASMECALGLQALIIAQDNNTAARNVSLRTGKERCMATSQEDTDFFDKMTNNPLYELCMLRVTSIAGRQSDSNTPIVLLPFPAPPPLAFLTVRSPLQATQHI
jgi:hypothetical protein